MTIYGYARVSGPAQDHARQVEQLTAAGCERIYSEKASAAAGRKRPELQRLVTALQAGDVLIVTNLDRFARSALDALNVLKAVSERGAAFRSLAQPWADTTTPAGRLMATIFAGFAEFDREMIVERTSAGRTRARARGVKLGPPFRLNRDQVAFIQRARSGPKADRIPIGQLQRMFKVGRSTICRAARAAVEEFETPPPTPLEQAISAVSTD